MERVMTSLVYLWYKLTWKLPSEIYKCKNNEWKKLWKYHMKDFIEKYQKVKDQLYKVVLMVAVC
jgi:hypothetical protein